MIPTARVASRVTMADVTTTLAEPAPFRHARIGGPARSRRGLFPHLAHPRDALAHVTPNWFAAVMGTGIVANAAATLPIRLPGLRGFALGVWAAALLALVVLGVALGLHWRRHGDEARRYAGHPVMGQFYGAPPMAMLTVGAGALLVGHEVIGLRAALVVDVVLWTAGTLTGLATSLWVPYRMITDPDRGEVTALPAWLMPLVPPMVSASTGALLVPHAAAGQARLTLLLACYAMFGLSLILGMITITVIWSRLLHAGPPVVQAAPTVWIALGVIGQSITAVNLLGADSALVFAGSQAELATGLRVFGLVFGVSMGGFGVLFFTLACLLTAHAARRGLTFSLTWWSFTFPVGTCVTGATTLAATARSVAIRDLAALLFVVLLGAWATVAANTLRGAISGRLLLPA